MLLRVVLGHEYTLNLVVVPSAINLLRHNYAFLFSTRLWLQIKLWLVFVWFLISKHFYFVTCASWTVSSKSWLAKTSKGSFGVVTIHMICITIMLSCFTLVYICKNQYRYIFFCHLKADICFFSIYYKFRTYSNKNVCIEDFLPFWQRFPLKPEGHKHRYRFTVNPDWQVPPL